MLECLTSGVFFSLSRKTVGATRDVCSLSNSIELEHRPEHNVTSLNSVSARVCLLSIKKPHTKYLQYNHVIASLNDWLFVVYLAVRFAAQYFSMCFDYMRPNYERFVSYGDVTDTKHNIAITLFSRNEID